MELLEISRGHLKVKNGDHVATIYGEAFLRGYGSPDFLVYANTIEKWDAPYEKEEITQTKKMRFCGFFKKSLQEEK